MAGLCYGVQIERVTTEIVNADTHVIVNYDVLPEAPTLFTLTEGSLRLVIDTSARTSATLPVSPLLGAGNVMRIRHAVRGSGTRLVLDLDSGTVLSSQSHSDLQTLIVLSGPKSVTLTPPEPARANPIQASQLHADTPSANILGAKPLAISYSDTIPAPRAAQRSMTGIPIPRFKPVISRAPKRKPVIVIDPGHGGYDPGAVGGAGSKEKTVTLAAAKILQQQLIGTGRYEAILTRSKDIYVVHDERVRIARLQEADLFISLHADSLEKRTTRGASVYTLADYARKRSTKLVDSQNWIMDVDLTKENNQVGNILVDLAQRKTFSNSDRFAEMLVPRLSKVTKVLGNTHRRAGLAVLLAPDVPAVLLEMGFISNAEDETALNSSSHRSKLMASVVQTVDAYFSE